VEVDGVVGSPQPVAALPTGSRLFFQLPAMRTGGGIAFVKAGLNLIAGFFVRRFGGLQNRTTRAIDPSLKLSLCYFLAKGDNSRHLSKQRARGNFGGPSGSTLG
jgi:hypothetical protein